VSREEKERLLRKKPDAEDAHVRLIVLRGPNKGHEYLLPGDESTIGRSTSNSIVLPFAEISRKHARVWQDNESTYLEDLGSTNGTFVNGRRLNGRVALYDGDEIQIGDTFRLLVATPEGVTRSVSGASAAAVQAPNPAGVSGGYSEIVPDPEIPTPKPPLYANLDELDSVAQQPDAGRSPDYMRWIGVAGLAAIILILLSLILLDSYQGGRLLYCGSLRPFFEIVLGPFGFNPICP
jgi:pSer/pThr/pTyr-binding forkhead associated (FHA) protein